MIFLAEGEGGAMPSFNPELASSLQRSQNSFNRSIEIAGERNRCPSAGRTGICAGPAKLKLPLQLECELNFTWQSRKLGYISDTGGRAIGVEDSRVAVAAAGLRGNEVRVVEDVKDLGAELNVKRFRDSGNRECLVNREVHVHEMRAHQLVPADVEG